MTKHLSFSQEITTFADESIIIINMWEKESTHPNTT